MPAVYKLEKSAQWVGPLQKMPAKSPILPPSLLEAYDTRKKCLKHKESVDENKTETIRSFGKVQIIDQMPREKWLNATS